MGRNDGTNKLCSRCGKYAVFSKNRSKPDGLATYCKTCCSAYRVAYRRQHLKAVSAAERTYNATYYKKHRKLLLTRAAKWIEANYEHVTEYKAKWRSANRTKLCEQSIKWARANRDKRRDYMECRRAWKCGAKSEKIERQKVYERDKGLCHICGRAVFHDNWHLDHIIPLFKGGEHSYRNVTVSHPGCNLRKGAA